MTSAPSLKNRLLGDFLVIGLDRVNHGSMMGLKFNNEEQTYEFCR